MRTVKIGFLFNDFSEKFKTIDILYLDILKEHYKVILSDEPEYLFIHEPRGWNVIGNEYELYKNCVRCQIAVENIRPDFNVFDFAIGGIHNLSYGGRYLFLPCGILFRGVPPKYRKNLFHNNYDWKEVLEKHENVTKELADRKFCSFLVSNSETSDYEREFFFRKLSDYKKVDSGGKYLNNIGKFIENSIEFEKKYKFAIVFENAWNASITEKLDVAFAAQTVPIYWGNTDVGELYNERAFINCHRYTNFDDVVSRIMEVDQNDDLYLSILREPALISSKSEETYMKMLEDFLVNMIEMPMNRAILRTDVGWSRFVQNVHRLGLNEAYKLRIQGINLMNDIGDGSNIRI